MAAKKQERFSRACLTRFDSDEDEGIILRVEVQTEDEEQARRIAREFGSVIAAEDAVGQCRAKVYK